MLQFVCDYCGSVKETYENWIHGVAAENIGTQAARREVIIDPAWRYERAVLPLAVHFCCRQCKDRYLAELFRRVPAVLEVEKVTVDPAAESRVIVAKKKPATETVKRRTTTKRTHRR